MRIGSIDLEKEVLIVAEIGNNHEGSCALAEEMIERAAAAGAGAVKFQTFRTEHYVTSRNKARFEQLKSYELTFAEFARLKKRADEAGVIFLSTPFDIISARFLNELVPAFKISSGDNTFYPLLETVASFKKPVLFSCGLSTVEQIKYSKALIECIWEKNGVDPGFVALHCVSSYPVPAREANLSAIRTLKKELRCLVGYSDHTLGLEASVVSVILGARVVEKHFTVDKGYSNFRDHQLSADPKEFKVLVERIRTAQELLGTGKKEMQEGERKIAGQVRRSIAASRDLKMGEVIRVEDITWVRPGEGIPPGRESKVIGRTVAREVVRGELITFDCLE